MTKAFAFEIKGDGKTDIRDIMQQILSGEGNPELAGIGEAIKEMVQQSGGGRRKKAAFTVMKNTASYVQGGGDTMLRFPLGLVRDAVDYVDHKNGLLFHMAGRFQELAEAALELDKGGLREWMEENADDIETLLDRIREERAGQKAEADGLAEMVSNLQSQLDQKQALLDGLTNDLTRERHLHAQARGLLDDGMPAHDLGAKEQEAWYDRHRAYQSDAATLAVAPETLDEQRPTAESLEAWIRQVKAGGLLLSRAQMLQVLRYALQWVDRDPNSAALNYDDPGAQGHTGRFTTNPPPSAEEQENKERIEAFYAVNA